MKIFIALIVTVAVQLQLIEGQEADVQGRHLRLFHKEPDRCERGRRCRISGRNPDDDDYRTEKDRPAVLTRDDYPVPPSDGRAGIGSDYKPPKDDDVKIKDDDDSKAIKKEDEKPRPADDLDYIPKPVGVRDEYKPKPDDDYIPKPVGARDEYKPKPVDRDEYLPKPVGGRDDYKPVIRDDSETKPIDRDDYKPKIPDEDEYKPKPVVRDDYDTKPVSRDEHKPKHVEDDDYNPKPVDRVRYIPRPVITAEYIPKAVITMGYKPEAVIVENYKPRPSSDSSRELYPRPVVHDEYKPKPVVDDEDYNPKHGGAKDEYETKPVRDRDEYDSKPAVSRDEYKPKPVRDRDEYMPRPVGDRDHYNPKPVAGRDDYNPRPVGGRDDYNPKPGGDRDAYNPKPVGGSDDYNPRPVGGRDEYNPKPVSGRDDYNPKPVGGRDDYNPKPVGGRDDYNPRPVGGRDDYKPKPIDDRDDYNPSGGRDDYNPRPVGGGGGRDDYNPRPVGGGGGRGDYNPRPVGGGGGGGGYQPKPIETGLPNKPDLGGYKEPKDDDYNDDTDFDDDDKVVDYDDGGQPEPVIENKNCICVPYYQCQDGHIVTDGSGIIDARKRPDPAEDLPLDGKFSPSSCGPFHVCCHSPQSSTVKPYEHRCGVRNPSGINSRILSPSNKGEADFGEWPWQAAVLKSEGKVNIFQCGGVLIDKYHVLTVAHCVYHLYKYNEYPLKVRLGEWDTQTTSEFLAHEDYKVAKIHIHPEYRNSSLWNDLAILKLEEAVLFAPHIDTVCLPQYDEVFAGQNCVVTGWGKDAYKGGTFSNVMKEVALQVIDNYKCEELLRKTRLGRFFQLHEGFVCAGGEHGLDSCKGDGGGPLVCYRKDKSYALAGIVSWGIDCGQPGVPGVYVKIQKFLDWISKTTGVELQDYWPKHH